MMPEMDGLEVCAALKKMALARSIPVILLTAKDDAETCQQATRLGVSEFAVKPVSLKDLLARIQIQLAVSRKIPKREPVPTGKKPAKTKK
jgi:response regulator RpfG family c-di-GMP phosphodiesterase